MFFKRFAAYLTGVAVAAAVMMTPASAEAADEADIAGGEEENKNYFSLSLTEPADADYSEDGTNAYMLINNPGGESRGGKDKWDVQLGSKIFGIQKGHIYSVMYNISASKDGYYYTKIGNLDSQTVGTANAGEIWHNQSGIANISSYFEGIIEKNQKVDYNSGWDLQPITKGDTICANSLFMSQEDLPECQWVFFLGGDGQYTPTGCFTEGTELEFTNLVLRDLTMNETLVEYGADPDSALMALGNLDLNKEIDMTDLSLLSLYLVGDISLDRTQRMLADCNSDGKINIADLPQLLQTIIPQNNSQSE